MTISALREQLDNKKISVPEIVGEYIEKIKNADGKINSFITLCEERAIEDAENAQKRINSGKSTPLTGIPLSIKDNICTAGIKTTCASKMLAEFVPPYDATVVSKLQGAGAVMIGKTNMDEFAMGASSQTSYFGGVKNPYDVTRVAGGSSGGSAAAVSAGFCVGALGSDTGGSVRQPAAFCGVTGLKPTYAAVSRSGLIAFASSLEQIGTIAMSASDCGVILSAIAGQDKYDATSVQLEKVDYTSKIGMSMKGIKIGVIREYFSDSISDRVKDAVIKAADYYKRAGAKLCEVSLASLEYAVSAYYLISSAEAASNLSRYDGIRFGYRSENGSTFEEVIANTRREGFGDEVKRRILLGNYALSSGYFDEYYKKASKIRTRIKAEFDDIFKSCDYIITPTAPDTAYTIDEMENDPVKMYSADICTVPVNIAGLPAISTTCGYDEKGLPVGMSIIGRAFDESGIIAVADAFEREFERREVRL